MKSVGEGIREHAPNAFVSVSQTRWMRWWPREFLACHRKSVAWRAFWILLGSVISLQKNLTYQCEMTAFVLGGHVIMVPWRAIRLLYTLPDPAEWADNSGTAGCNH